MRHILRAGAEMEDGKNLRAGVDGQPQPEHLFVAAQPGAQFIQLEVRELEIARWERSCKVYACSPARVSQVVMVACR
jgi:hypothetical protein